VTRGQVVSMWSCPGVRGAAASSGLMQSRKRISVERFSERKVAYVGRMRAECMCQMYLTDWRTQTTEGLIRTAFRISPQQILSQEEDTERFLGRSYMSLPALRMP
jgi:hypothetical protein